MKNMDNITRKSNMNTKDAMTQSNTSKSPIKDWKILIRWENCDLVLKTKT